MSGAVESVLDLKGSVLPTATAREDSLDRLQMSMILMAYHVFSVSTRLFTAPHVSHSWTGNPTGWLWALAVPTHAANRVLGCYIPSSAPPPSGKFSTWSAGERLLLTPRELSVGAPIPEEVASTGGGFNNQHEFNLHDANSVEGEDAIACSQALRIKELLPPRIKGTSQRAARRRVERWGGSPGTKEAGRTLYLACSGALD